ncbi:MAG: hypothetical protein GX591_01175 [Planctomycetes bacterium]|nr:hypothetical protein [Planctomycetota bacterium]
MRRSRSAPGRAAGALIILALAVAAVGAGDDAPAAPQPPDLARVDDTAHVRTTDHFVVRGHNGPLVDLLASSAERTLARLGRRRLAAPAAAAPIEIIIHPTREAYGAAVGADLAGAEAHVAIRRADDGTLERTIHLVQRTDEGRFDDRLLGRILPHEIAHAVLEARFVKASAPLYLQEALAVAAEAGEHRTAILLAGLAVAEGRDLPLEDLVRRDEVEAEQAALFYAQSYSLVTYLRRQLTERQFKRFLDELAGGQPTFDALRRALRVGHDASFAARLQQAWRDDAVRQAALVAATEPAGRAASQPAQGG